MSASAGGGSVFTSPGAFGLYGDLVAGGLGFGGAALQTSANERAQRKAIKAARYNYQHRYQWTMEDMRKAGLNPILAAGRGLGGGASAAAYGAPGQPNPLEAAATSARSIGRRIAQQQVEKAQAEIAALEAQKGQYQAGAFHHDQQGKFILDQRVAGVPAADAAQKRAQAAQTSAQSRITTIGADVLEDWEVLKLMQFAKQAGIIGIAGWALGRTPASQMVKYLRNTRAGRRVLRTFDRWRFKVKPTLKYPAGRMFPGISP